MKIRFKGIAAAAAFLAFLFSPVSAHTTHAASVFPSLDPGWQEIYGESFENSAGDWTPLGGSAVFDFDSKYSKHGAYSLLVKERSDSWAGPSLYTTDLLEAGHKYKFRAFARHEGTGTFKLNLVLKYNTTYNPEYQYDQIASIDMDDRGWNLIEAIYTIPSDALETTIYFEMPDKEINFALDKISIAGQNESAYTTKASENQEYSFGFEEGVENWRIFGDALIDRSTNSSHTGRYSLYISEREDSESVPLLNITTMVKPSISYEYTAYAMFNARNYADNYNFRLLLRYTTSDDEEAEIVLDEKKLQKGNWSRLTGEILLPEGAGNINLIIETDGTAENSSSSKITPIAFYIDDVKIIDSTIINQREASVLIIRILIIFFSVLTSAVIIMIVFHRVGVSNSILADASTDTMTRAYNRNSYEIQIAHLENCPEECKKLWVTLCDVNFLKHINDNYGHLKGDDAIIRCANVLTDTVQKKGIVYRTGGDEFVCMTKVNMHEKIREALALEARQYKGYPFSVAVGTATYVQEEDGNTPSIKLILERSDKEMYRHKEEIKKEMKNMM